MATGADLIGKEPVTELGIITMSVEDRVGQTCLRQLTVRDGLF